MSDWAEEKAKQLVIDARKGDVFRAGHEISMAHSIASALREARTAALDEAAKAAEDMYSPDTCPVCPRTVAEKILSLKGGA